MLIVVMCSFPWQNYITSKWKTTGVSLCWVVWRAWIKMGKNYNFEYKITHVKCFFFFLNQGITCFQELGRHLVEIVMKIHNKSQVEKNVWPKLAPYLSGGFLAHIWLWPMALTQGESNCINSAAYPPDVAQINIFFGPLSHAWRSQHLSYPMSKLADGMWVTFSSYNKIQNLC